jgi:hypothetical protein
MSEFQAAEPPPDFFAEQAELYAEAMHRWTAIKAEWEAAGSPMLAKGSMGQLREHPLVKMLREHEVVVMRLAAPLQVRHRGPQPSAVLARSVPKSRGAGLRAVGD